jgi:hypothetical protein
LLSRLYTWVIGFDFDIDPGGKIEALGAAPKDFRKPHLPQLATANEHPSTRAI